MPYKYNPFTGELDYYQTGEMNLSEASSISSIAVDDTIAMTDTSADSANGKMTVSEFHRQYQAIRPRYGFNFFTDFLQEISATATDNGFSETNSGTGAATSAHVNDEQGRVGVVRSTTGTTSTGRAAIATNSTAVRLGGASIFFETALKVTTLSNGTERFQLVVGIIDTLTAADQVDAVAFVYDEGGVSTGSSASANWQVITSSSSVGTWTTTSTAVSAGTWVRLGVEVNASGTSATFYINGTLVATHSTNIPTASGRQCGFGVLLIKSVGSTARTVDYDYMNIVGEFTTPR